MWSRLTSGHIQGGFYKLASLVFTAQYLLPNESGFPQTLKGEENGGVGPVPSFPSAPCSLGFVAILKWSWRQRASEGREANVNQNHLESHPSSQPPPSTHQQGPCWKPEALSVRRRGGQFQQGAVCGGTVRV